jgi:sporulation protein YlmC with PRC-barrel domain
MEREISKWVRAAFIPAVGLSLAMPVFAAGDNTQSSNQTSASSQSSAQQSAKAQKQNLREMRASQLIGRDVTNAQGQDLGEISDLIVDMKSGEVRYAILQFDQGVFSSDKLFAVPTSELKFSQGNDKLVYNMRREQLQNAGVDKNQWPRATRNNDYMSGLDRTYGIVQPSNDRRAYSASELLGKDVNGMNDNDVGEIRDLVIDMNGQRVHYAVLAFDPSWTAPEKLYAFPVSAFKFTDGKDELALNVTKSQLQAMRSFDHGLWTAYSTPVFVTDIDRYLVTITPISGGSQSTSGQSSSTSSSLAASNQGTSSSNASRGSTGSSSSSSMNNQTSSSGQAGSASPMSQSDRSGAASSSKAGQNTGASTSGNNSGKVGVIDAPPPQYTAAMKRLQDSAQRLRESIQAMAQHPPGDNRDKAIKDAQQALYDTNEAMIQLPPDMRTVSGDKAQGTGTTAAAGASGAAGSASGSEAEYKKSTRALQQSSQQLHDAIQAISQQPQGQRRDQAIQEAKQALNEVGQAMTQLGATTHASSK